MTDGFKDRFARIITIALVTIIGIGGAVSIWPTYRRGQKLKERDAELARQIEAKKREISTLIENQRRFKTDSDFVETIARKNNRVFPGELVFLFED